MKFMLILVGVTFAVSQDGPMPKPAPDPSAKEESKPESTKVKPQGGPPIKISVNGVDYYPDETAYKRITEIFATQLDLNSDGNYDKETEGRGTFGTADTDSSGGLDETELAESPFKEWSSKLKTLSDNPNLIRDQAIFDLIDAFDLNNNGKATLPEVVYYTLEKMNTQP